MKTLGRLLVVLLLSVFFTNNALTQTTYTWNGGSGDWNVATNWSPNGVPGNTDNVLITASGNYTVTLDVDTSIADISIGGTSGIQTLSLTGRTFTVNGTAMIGDSGSVSLTNSTINGIGLLTSTGTLTVTSSILDLDFDNDGFASFSGACYINNALTTQPNSTIRL
ncbi:MAG: hypothetical protein GQ561_07265, partial [Calditrichae bacterium]|nr:hypothetical protein [Calditrichia bacterium]